MSIESRLENIEKALTSIKQNLGVQGSGKWSALEAARSTGQSQGRGYAEESPSREESPRVNRLSFTIKGPVPIAVFFFFVLVAASYAERVKYPFLEVLFHELGLVALAVTVGALLLRIAEEPLATFSRDFASHQGDALQRGLVRLSRDFSDGLQGINATLKAGVTAGFVGLESALAKSLQPVYGPRLERTALVAEKSGESEEEKAVEALLNSAQEEDLKRAGEVLGNHKVSEANYLWTVRNYMNLAYKFWSIGLLPQAIETAEKTLALVTSGGQPKWIAADRPKWEKYKYAVLNSLAYYYADAQKPEYEEKARAYIKEAREHRPDAMEPLDTEGFVLIAYGRDKQEVIEGISLCTEALEKGVPFEAYANHLQKAGERIKFFD
ncbi:MAG: hypothetical protein ACLQVM_12640 [Terriglobia bacterium]